MTLFRKYSDDRFLILTRDSRLPDDRLSLKTLNLAFFVKKYKLQNFKCMDKESHGQVKFSKRSSLTLRSDQIFSQMEILVMLTKENFVILYQVVTDEIIAWKKSHL